MKGDLVDYENIMYSNYVSGAWIIFHIEQFIYKC